MPTCRRLPRHRQPPCGTPYWRGVRVLGALLLLLQHLDLDKPYFDLRTALRVYRPCPVQSRWHLHALHARAGRDAAEHAARGARPGGGRHTRAPRSAAQTWPRSRSTWRRPRPRCPRPAAPLPSACPGRPASPWRLNSAVGAWRRSRSGPPAPRKLTATTFDEK